MRFAIYGSGGLGAYYGIRLLQAGHDVVFIARGAHLQAIRNEGLFLQSPCGDAHIQNPEATDQPSKAGTVDVVLVAVKTWQVAEVAEAMKPMLHDKTMVVPFLNGVESPAQLADVLGPGPALGGLSKIFSLIEAPGRIKHINDHAYVAFGELDGRDSDRCGVLKQVFEGAGVEAEVFENIELELWKKLMMVTSWAGLGALSRSSIGVLRAQDEARALIDEAMDEILAVATARGIGEFPTDIKAQIWTFYDSLPIGATASMMRDIIEGKPSELDAWNGAVVRLGQQAGVPTPVHRFTYHALLPMERKARGES